MAPSVIKSTGNNASTVCVPGADSFADVIIRGHALVRNLNNGFSNLPVAILDNLRLYVAWSHLAQAIYILLDITVQTLDTSIHL